MDKIQSGSSFGSRERKASISLHRESLEIFASNFDKALKLENDIKIFVDTNVLIRYYKVSYKARVKLLDFFRSNAKRIFLTNQVEKEFTKNRRKNIEKYFEEVTKEIPSLFQKKIVNPITNFIQENKLILDDYDEINKSLQTLSLQSNSLLESLVNENKNKSKEAQKLIFDDEFLNLIDSFNKVEKLEQEEIEFLKKEFDDLSKELSSESIANFINKEENIFPGIGDVKEKPSNPYGDYIIFHEMLKYISTSKNDVVFITYDTAKGDWIRKTKMPHLEYIECTSLVNEDDSEDDLGKLKIKITKKILNEFLMDFDLYEEIPPHGHIPYEVLNQVRSCYTYLDELEYNLRRVFRFAMEYRENRGNKLNKVGMLNVSIKILNPKLTSKVEYEDRYKKYSNKMKAST